MCDDASRILPVLSGDALSRNKLFLATNITGYYEFNQ